MTLERPRNCGMGAGGQGHQPGLQGRAFKGEGLAIVSIAKGRRFTQSRLCDEAPAKPLNKGAPAPRGGRAHPHAGGGRWLLEGAEAPSPFPAPRPPGLFRLAVPELCLFMINWQSIGLRTFLSPMSYCSKLSNPKFRNPPICSQVGQKCGYPGDPLLWTSV